MNRRVWQWILILALAAVAAFSVWTETRMRRESAVGTRPAVGFRAPPFTAVDASTGATVRLADLRGKPVLINFWATWCPPCREEMPALDAARRAWDGRAHVIALDADESETPEQVLEFARELGVALPLLVDRTGAAARDYQAIRLPTSFFIDPAGIIRQIIPGAMSPEVIEAGLRAAGAGRR